LPPATGQSADASPRTWRKFAFLTLLALAFTASIETAAERSFYNTDDLIPVDFPVFYLGGKVALQRGATPLYYPPADRRQGYTLLYEYAAPATPWARMGQAEGFGPVLQFTNPPFSAVLMAPFALLPWRWAYLIWQFFIVVFAAASVYLALRLLSFTPDLGMYTALCAGACFFFPLRNTLVFGQVNATILFCWTLGVYLLQRRKPVASGLCFALGTALKVSPVAAVPFLIVRRQWRWLAAYVGGLALLTGLSVWQLGWPTHLTWLRDIYPCISPGLGNYVNRSLAGLLDALCGPKYVVTQLTATEWPIPTGLAWCEKVLGSAIGLAFLYWCWRRTKRSAGVVEDLVLLPLVFLLAAPFTWPHHFVLALLPLVYLWAKAREATTAELAALALGTLALGTELPMYAAYNSPWAAPYLIIAVLALSPAACCALIWVGTRLIVRSHASGGANDANASPPSPVSR
jgi:hypothetical protein